jgi:hypothetical protein
MEMYYHQVSDWILVNKKEMDLEIRKTTEVASCPTVLL